MGGTLQANRPGAGVVAADCERDSGVAGIAVQYTQRFKKIGADTRVSIST